MFPPLAGSCVLLKEKWNKIESLNSSFSSPLNNITCAKITPTNVYLLKYNQNNIYETLSY